jgi:hypothetical protein
MTTSISTDESTQAGKGRKQGQLGQPRQPGQPGATSGQAAAGQDQSGQGLGQAGGAVGQVSGGAGAVQGEALSQALAAALGVDPSTFQQMVNGNFCFRLRLHDLLRRDGLALLQVRCLSLVCLRHQKHWLTKVAS